MKRVGLILGIVVVVLCGLGYFGWKAAQGAKLAAQSKQSDLGEVKRQDLTQRVIETGTIDAVKSVEVKSRVGGRLKSLFVDEGDYVKAGQLIAEIDPQETELRVQQNEAQLRGAQSAVARTDIEIGQRRVTVQATLKQAEARVAQLQAELRAQPTLTSASIRSAKAQLDSAKQELDRLDKSAHPNARSANETALREAQANFNNAQSEYNRQKELRDQGFVSEKVVENTALALELARVRLRQAQENSGRLETQLRIERQRAIEDVTRSQAAYDQAVANSIQDVLKKKEYESALSDLAKAKASLRDVDTLIQTRIQSQASVDQLRSVRDDSRRELRETRILSPIDGIVTKKLVQVGELVASLSAFSSGTTILRVEDRNALRVKLTINEIDTAKLKLGLKAKVSVDAIPDREFQGDVKKIAPTSTALGATNAASVIGSTDSVVKYEVEIWLTGVDQRLRSGMSAKCTLDVASRTKTLTLPSEFVGKDAKGRFVEFPPVGKGPKAEPERRYVKTGLETGATIEILDGVKEGDKVQRPKFSGPERSGFMQAGPEE